MTHKTLGWILLLLLVSCSTDPKIQEALNSLNLKPSPEPLEYLHATSRDISELSYPRQGYFPLLNPSNPRRFPYQVYEEVRFYDYRRIRDIFFGRDVYLGSKLLIPTIPDSVLRIDLLTENISISHSNCIMNAVIQITNTSDRTIIFVDQDSLFTPFMYRFDDSEPSFITTEEAKLQYTFCGYRSNFDNDGQKIARFVKSMIDSKITLLPKQQITKTVSLDFRFPSNFNPYDQFFFLVSPKYYYTVMYRFDQAYLSIYNGIEDPDARDIVVGITQSNPGLLVVENK